MHSFKTTAIAAIALFVSTQAQVQYTIDPNSVPLATRQKWCEQEKATCPLLCLQLPGQSSTTAANTCDADTLTYQCICGNGQSPNASEYSQTLPYFICQEWGVQCVQNCGNNNACQSSCTQDHPCGAQNPTRVNTTASSSTMTATATGTDGAAASGGAAGTVYNGFGNGATATTTGSGSSSTGASTKSSAQAALDVGRSYGVAVIVAGLFAGFALVI